MSTYHKLYLECLGILTQIEGQLAAKQIMEMRTEHSVKELKELIHNLNDIEIARMAQEDKEHDQLHEDL